MLAARSRRRRTRKYNVGDRLQARAGPGPHHAHRRASTSSCARYGEHVVEEKLLRPGTPRRNWKHTLLSDGYLIVRHPDWRTAYELANIAATEITMYAE